MNQSIKSIDRRRIGISLVASIAAHALLVVIISVANTDKPLPNKKPPQIMDVVLLDSNKTKSVKPPEDAKTMSNLSAVGGSSKAQDKITRAARAPAVGQQQKPATKQMCQMHRRTNLAGIQALIEMETSLKK